MGLVAGTESEQASCGNASVVWLLNLADRTGSDLQIEPLRVVGTTDPVQ
jgi:hypothetical protein